MDKEQCRRLKGRNREEKVRTLDSTLTGIKTEMKEQKKGRRGR